VAYVHSTVTYARMALCLEFVCISRARR